MDAWYRVVSPRKEVREGRSFDPDEFAIHLEQVLAKTAPEDYRDPSKFFSRTHFTEALTEQCTIVLRRLSGQTTNAPPVLSLVTQFGGGKTHTLTALYHLIQNPAESAKDAGVQRVLGEAGLKKIPGGRVAVFVGNAWDPQKGRETPWLDVARQLAGDVGAKALGPKTVNTTPGTEALGRLFQAAGGRVLLLFDEVLDFVNRHRDMADAFYSFIRNISGAMTGTTHSAGVVSLPRSREEMTDFDQVWQDRITKVVRRVAKDLVANEAAEISEVVRRRLFEGIGKESARKAVARAYADWCFERGARLPSEWTAANSASSEKRARELLRERFEACYPFHPATLTVFQRKWQPLRHYQRTRGTLAMFAQWISWVFQESHRQLQREPLITLGSAPLHLSDFRTVILGQLGDDRLEAAILSDVVGENSHARALDAGAKGPLRDIHRRVGTAIFFESSGGMTEKLAHLPEVRFALGGPDLDTASIDNAAVALQRRAFFLRKAGTDGFRFGPQPTLRKVVSDRRASLDAEPGGQVDREMQGLIRTEFEKGAVLPLRFFPKDSAAVPDSPRLTLVVMPPEVEWEADGDLREQLLTWTRQRGDNDRLYPGAIVWCVRRGGRGLQDKVEQWLAWTKVKKEIDEGILPGEFEPSERANLSAEISNAREEARDEVWADYRYVILLDRKRDDEDAGERQDSPEGPEGTEYLRVIDLGAGHASSGETLTARVVTALKSEGCMNEMIGAGYLERHWPPAHRESGAWPLQGLRQSFVNGVLTRLRDPDAVLKAQIARFVANGELGLASGQKPDGSYERVWFKDAVGEEEVSFEPDVYLLAKEKAAALKEPEPAPAPIDEGGEVAPGEEERAGELEGTGAGEAVTGVVRMHVRGEIPPELWNRLGHRLIPKLRSGEQLSLAIDASFDIPSGDVANARRDIQQALADLGIADRVSVESS